jgi:hypothetical protein
LNQHQRDVIDYLQEETRVLREQLGSKRLRLNDDQRRRLAVKTKKMGWRVLHDPVRRPSSQSRARTVPRLVAASHTEP